MHDAVAQSVLREGIEIGRVDHAAIAAKLAEARIVQHDEQHVWRAFLRAMRRGPSRLGNIERPADDTVERLPRLVLLQLAGFATALARLSVGLRCHELLLIARSA